MKTFKIDQTNGKPYEVIGEIVSETTGDYFYACILRSTQDVYVLVVSNYREGWQVVHPFSAFAGLMHILSSFATEPTPTTVKNLLVHGQGWAADLKVRQDLLASVDVLQRDLIEDYHPSELQHNYSV